MKDTRKSRLIMVLSANLALSVLVGFAFWSGKNSTSNSEKAKQASSTQEPTKKSAGSSSEEAPKIAEHYPATTREQAEADAKKALLERNGFSPMAPIAAREKTKANAAGTKEPHTKDLTAHINPGFKVPPPPPATEQFDHPFVRSAPRASFAHFKAEAPFSKIAAIKLTAVIGNKAMLSLRREGMRKNERPEVICLAAGDQVKTNNNLDISVVAVEADRVTLDVDGTRLVKSLPDVR